MSNLEFAVGRRVVCIDPHPQWIDYPRYSFPQKGAVYTVREIRDTPVGLSLLLDEISNAGLGSRFGGETCFLIKRFRPVRETSIDCFTKLLEKQPELVGGDA